VRAVIDARFVPVVPALRALFADEWLEMAIRGGEDFELLATVPADRMDALMTAAEAIGATLTDIGEVLSAGDPLLTMIDLDGTTNALAAGAYDHFG
jgi:thiamine-monophosphate kinase